MIKQLLLCTLFLPLLTACPHDSKRYPLTWNDVPEAYNESGVVIAEGVPIGMASAVGKDLSTPDCKGGRGFGVQINSSRGENKFLLDIDGENCEIATTLFDGRLAVDNRAAPLSVNIDFIDRYGPIISKKTKVEEVAVVAVGNSPKLPEDFALQRDIEVQTENADVIPADILAVTKNNKPSLEDTISKWEEDAEHALILKESERLMANVRDLNRMSSGEVLQLHQKQIARLMAKVRDSERRLESQQVRNLELMSEIEKSRNIEDAQNVALSQERRQMRQELEETSRKLREFEELNQRLQYATNRKEKVYNKRLSEMSRDLQVAEKLAEKSRQELILEAAKKIAEAERLAFVANVQKQATMKREALRLNSEASDIMKRANDLGQGRTIIVPGMENIELFSMGKGNKIRGSNTGAQVAAIATPHMYNELPNKQSQIKPLEASTVTVHEEDATLEEIIRSSLRSIAGIGKEWDVSFQLDFTNQHILKEKWTVSAESRFDEFLAYIASQVRDTHNIELNFRQFDRAKMLLITDK